MKSHHHPTRLMVVLALLPAIVSSVAAESSHSWNAFAVDFNALGGAAINSKNSGSKSPADAEVGRTATYRVPISQAGKYDLYMRWIPGGVFISQSLGDTPQWREVKTINGTAGEYGWVNLSEALGHPKTGGLTYEVAQPGTVTFKIATRSAGTRIDAFAFGSADQSFTDDQLNAAAQNNRTAKTAGLFGFQAEAAATFGDEVVSEQVRKTQEEYANRLAGLTKEIREALPKRDEAKVAAWLAAVQAEEVFAKEAAATAKALATLQAAPEKLRQMEENLKFGPKTLEDAQAELARARARGEENPERAKELASAENFLASRQKEIDKLNGDIANARAAVEKAKVELPAAIQAADGAQQAYDNAMANTWKAMDALGMDEILGSAALDGKLAQAMVLETANPHELAKFAGKSPENKDLIQQLFSNEALMIQMLVADGPTGGRFGEAMKIYTDIQKASPKAKDGVFQRLALAVSLAHAVPIEKRTNMGGDSKEGDETVAGDNSANTIDPVKRYQNYENWYLDGELDQGFKDLSVWNMAMAVNASDPDEILAWGRAMLHNLRPDCIPRNGDTTVYVDVVDKEIRYGSDGVVNDRPELALMQNILANGGICGRRAFFGRFILQAFGIPTAARKEPGHATLAHWHPDGWATRLGGVSKPGENWRPGGRGFYAAMNDARTSSYRADVNFHASSRAREDAAAFMRVKRAQWIGAFVGEDPKPGLITWSGKTKGPAPVKPGEVVKPIFWNELALQEQRRINAGMKSANDASSVAATEPAATGKVTIDGKGVITIPAAACSSPTGSTKALYRGGYTDLVVFLKDHKSGDTRLHLSRYSKGSDTFEYTFDTQKGGKCQLVASLVTPKWDQSLFVSANGGTVVEMALPYTTGLWDKTAPVVIELKAGQNVLKFHGPARVTLGQFTLTPIPNPQP